MILKNKILAIILDQTRFYKITLNCTIFLVNIIVKLVDLFFSQKEITYIIVSPIYCEINLFRKVNITLICNTINIPFSLSKY